MSTAKGSTYDEEMVKPDAQASNINEEEYLAEVGELNCYCVPSRVYGLKDFFFRTLAWFLLNKEQLLGGFTGEFCVPCDNLYEFELEHKPSLTRSYLALNVSRNHTDC